MSSLDIFGLNGEDSDGQVSDNDAEPSKAINLAEKNAGADNSDDDFEEEEEAEDQVFQIKSKINHKDLSVGDENNIETFLDEFGTQAINDEDEEQQEVEHEDAAKSSTTKSKKLRKLTPEQLLQQEKKMRKSGVCYLSRIPPYMKPATLKSILSRFGEIDRIFLKPEDSSSYKKRVKYGGNKKKNYTEGWVEFVRKKDAKLCASTLNGNILGGKKTSYYYDDVINMKYLSGFKWIDLTSQISKENEIRQSKLALELSQQRKLNKSFIENVEKSKMINNIKEKKKAKSTEDKRENEDEIDFRRDFKQRKITSTRADAHESLKKAAKPNETLDGVLSKIF